MVVSNQTGGEGVATVSSAGVDEAGRSLLVGSVFTAAVILPEYFDLSGLTNSGKPNEKKYDMSTQMTKEQTVAWSTAFADPGEVLQPNILYATMAVMKHAIEGLSVVPDKVWIDGNRVSKDLNVPAEAVVKGDSKIIEISVASISAKTACDAEAYELAKRYP